MFNASGASVRFGNLVFKAVHLFVILIMVLQCFAIAAPAQAKSAESIPVEEKAVQASPKDIEPKMVYHAPEYTHPEAIRSDRLRAAKQQDGENSQPIMFIENEGQENSAVRFQVQGGSTTLNFVQDGVWMSVIKPEVLERQLSEPVPLDEDGILDPTPQPNSPSDANNEIDGVNIHAIFDGANQNAVVEGFDPIDTNVSYFRGNDPSQWQSDVPVWGGIRYKDIFPGYDLEIIGSNGVMTQHLVRKEEEEDPGPFSLFGLFAPPVDESQELNLTFEGVQDVNIVGNQKVLTTELGDILFPILSTGDIQSGTEEFHSLFNSSDPDIFNIESNADITREFGINFSTYIGNGLGEDIVVDDLTGESFIIGCTYSLEFPLLAGGIHANNTYSPNIILLKLSEDGHQLLFGVLIGSAGGDWAVDLALGSDKSIYFTGYSEGEDYPTTDGSYQRIFSPFRNTVVTKISPDGTQLIYSTFITGAVEGHSIAVDSSGNAYITGRTFGGIPTTQGAYDTSWNGGFSDGYLLKLNPTGSGIIYSTFIGGLGTDCEEPYDNEECVLAVNNAGEVTMAGITHSTNFPTTEGAYNRTIRDGDAEIFVLRMNASGSDLIYSTFFGSPVKDFGSTIEIALDNDDSAIIAGQAQSNLIPTTPGGFQEEAQGRYDGFISKISPDGSSLIFGSYFGGSETDSISDIELTEQGQIIVTGTTESPDFPVTEFAAQNQIACTKRYCTNAFVSILSSDGTRLLYSTYWGGSKTEWGMGVDNGPLNSIYITGETQSFDFPVSDDAYNSVISGTNSIYVASFYFPSKIAEYNTYTLGDCDHCDPEQKEPSTGKDAQQAEGDPVNARTGGFNLPFTDLDFKTSTGTFKFARDYASEVSQKSESYLGFGWTHNFNGRLIFSDDPGGIEGKVLVQLYSSNLYGFKIEPNGSFSPESGILATLTKISSDPDRYELITSDQKTIIFEEKRLISVTDRNGHTISYTYDEFNRLAQISADGGQRFLNLSYNNQDLISSVSDHTGRSVSYGYNESNDLISVMDVMGRSWEFSYDNNHHMLEVRNPLDQSKVRNEYDETGRVVRQYDGNDHLIVELSYGPDGITTVTDALGQTEMVHHNELNAVGSEQDAAGGITQKKYDLNYRPTQITDPLNHATQLEWSEDGANLTRLVDAGGNPIDLSYDSYNNVTSVVDPLTNLTQYFYEDSAHPTQVTHMIDAGGAETFYTYTAEGRPETVTDPRGNITRYTYDEFGQPASMELQSIPDEFGTARTINIRYAYDNLGRLVDTSKAQFVDGSATETLITHNEYDAAGHLTRVTRNYDPTKGPNEAFTNAAGFTDYYNVSSAYGFDEVGRQVQVTDTFGNTIQYQYDPAGNLVKTIDPAGHETTNTYNEANQLVSTTDALGRTTSHAYDAAGREISTTDALGNTTSTVYNLDGTVQKTVDARGNETSYTYDELKRVTAVTDPAGGMTRTTYDEAGNVLSTTDPLGNVVGNQYDPLGRLIRQTYIMQDGSSYAKENFYDADGNLIQSTDLNGNPTTNTYDGFNQLVKVEDALGNATTFEYDANGSRTAQVDAQQHRTEFVYDTQGRQVISRDAAGVETRSEYDALGRLLSTTNGNGKTTNYEYDGLGRMVKEINPVGGETSYTYDELGNRLTVTDPNGNTTTYGYDELNRLVATTDANGNTTTTEYDESGNVTAQTNGEGETTRFEYDDLNRQVRQIDPLGQVTEYGYDANGNRVSITDPDGTVTAFEYDALARLTAVVENYRPGENSDEQTNVRTEYAYDANGNRLSILDGNGHETTFAYDALNRLTSESDALGNTTHYVYDELGNRTEVTDANGQATQYAYTARGEVDSISYPDAMISFTYNNLGQRTSMTDPSGVTNWTYDDLGRATQIESNGFSVGYEYDAAGNRTALHYPDGKTASYTYDPANRLQDVTAEWRAQATTYAYDAANRLINAVLPDGTQSTYIYDDAGHLTQLTHQGPERLWASYQYEYDESGNRIRAVESMALAAYLPFVSVAVTDSLGKPVEGIPVYAFTDDVYSGISATSGADGVARLTLPEGAYRFRADQKGYQFWSGEQNSCEVLGCEKASVTVPLFGDVVISVKDSTGTALPGMPVYAFKDETYTGANKLTDEKGQATLTLPQGAYRFRTDKNGLQYFSGEAGHCLVPDGCQAAAITVAQFGTVSVAVTNTTGAVEPEIAVYAFDGTTYTGAHAVSNQDGVAEFILPEGNYRFRADKNNLQYWSSPENNCAVLGCVAAAVTLPLFGDVTVTATDADGLPDVGDNVYVFNGTTYTGFNGITNETGQVTFTLPEGNYRFRVDEFGYQYFSAPQNHCAVPGCESATVATPVYGEVHVGVFDADGDPQNEIPVYIFDGETYTGITGKTDSYGWAYFFLPKGDYRFRADVDGVQHWSGEDNHCAVAGDCAEYAFTLPEGLWKQIWVDVRLYGDTLPNMEVEVYQNGEYTGFHGNTGENRYFLMRLPAGQYTFRTTYNGEEVESEQVCEIPGCHNVYFEVGEPIIVTVHDNLGNPAPNVWVHMFDGENETGFDAQTNENGQAKFHPTPGNYRFRADYNGYGFWSDSENHCEFPGCFEAEIIIGQSITVTILDANGDPAPGYTVQVYNGNVDTGISAQTNEFGQVSFNQPPGTYRFSATRFLSQVYWSGPENHCNFPACSEVTFSLTEEYLDQSLEIKVVDLEWNPVPGVSVVGLQNGIPTKYAGITDENGTLKFLPEPGSYLFQAEFQGQHFWHYADHSVCNYPECKYQYIQVMPHVGTGQLIVKTLNEGGEPLSGVEIDAALPDSYIWYAATSDENGEAHFSLEYNTYHIAARTEDLHFAEGNVICDQPDCGTVILTFSEQSSAGNVRLARVLSISSDPVKNAAPQAENSPVVIHVNDTTGAAAGGLNVYAFNGSTYTGLHTVTDDTGKAQLYLPAGSYRFRVDKFGKQYWSGSGNHCTTPDCASIAVTVPVFGLVTTTVTDSSSAAAPGLAVYAFNGSTYTGMRATTDANGQAVFNLPEGDYRFRADKNALQYWSGSANHCTVPACADAAISVPLFGMVTVSVHTGGGSPEAGLKVYAFRGATYTGFNATSDAAGQVIFNLPEGDYRFRADKNGQQYWSGAENHCTVAGCTSADVTIPVFGQVTVHASTGGGSAQAGVTVYVFNETVYTGFSAATNEAGDAAFTLPEGSYRFRADKNGVQYWSGAANHCAVPACAGASVTVPVFGDVAVTVTDTGGAPQADLPVYVFDEATYTGFHAVTDASGVAAFTLPEGNYRFRADKNDLQYWSGLANHCAVPGCAGAFVSVPDFQTVSVTVKDSVGEAQPELPVYVFNAGNYTGFHAVTDAQGQVSFTLPVNAYRFRADVHGHQYWSGEEGHCALPECASTEVSVPRFGQVTVSVEYRDGEKLTGLPVYAFSDTTYTGISGVSDSAGQVQLWLPEGAYRFRADQYALHFWSEDTCTVPECTFLPVYTYATGADPRQEVEITYTYDALQRLTGAEYSSGVFYHYTYDAAGNRLSQEARLPGGEPVTTGYTYDEANRLTRVGEQAYTWDANGNLLDDGQRQYEYDAANRLVALTEGEVSSTYAYNGLGNRVSQSVNGVTETYQLDLNAGLTQVLSDGTITYLYGLGRVSQESGDGVGLFLPDGLGSVRTVVAGGKVSLARDYAPYGAELARSGAGTSEYGYAGEWTDHSGMQYLRARYYDPSVGRFVSRDNWEGIPFKPQTLNHWQYADGNPILLIDSSGYFSSSPIHAMIQAHFMETFGAGHIVFPEFYVEQGSKKGLKLIDNGQLDFPQLAGFPSMNAGFIDIVDISTNQAYEIKKENETTLARAEIIRYVAIYNSNPRPEGPAFLVEGTNYRWAITGWEVIGTNPSSPDQAILTQMRASGVISYRLEKKDKLPAHLPDYVWEWNPKTRMVEKHERSSVPSWSSVPVSFMEETSRICNGVLLVGVTFALLSDPFPDEFAIPIIWALAK